MKTDNTYKYAKLKVWLGFTALFICGAMVGVGIANWGHSVKQNAAPVVEQGDVRDAIVAFAERESAKDADKETLTICQSVEKVLLNRLYDDDDNCDGVAHDLDIYKKLVEYGCDENKDSYIKNLQNKQAILDVVCVGYHFNNMNVMQNIKTTCGKIEESLDARLPYVDAGSSAETHIERAKIYAIMAEKGCPENNQKYGALAKQELEIARAVQDDKFDEQETLEVVETYKRLKMQQDAEEIFNKAKKLTNPAIDFIMQVEKIINE